jgi:hypoxanthine phosphoribosyltransferase
MVEYEQLPPIAEILLDDVTLQNRIQELGREISEAYRHATEDILLICILKGGVLFLTDLMRSISIPHAIGFMAVSSYGVGNRRSTGEVRILMDIDQQVRGKHIILVEDIIDSGNTLSYILMQLSARQPASLEVCCLLSKPARREVDIPVKFLGFEIADKFVFGYGLDLDEKFRNLPFIAVYSPQVGEPYNPQFTHP